MFELFFRKNPFHGEYTVFAGLDHILKFVERFHFSAADIEYLRGAMDPSTDPRFFEWLASLDGSGIKIYACAEGTVCFPKIPVVRVMGPLAVALLNAVMAPSRSPCLRSAMPRW